MSDAAATSAPPSLVGKMTTAVGSNPGMALAALVVLTVALVSALVYYRGFMSFGPYAKGRPARAAKAAAAAAPAEEKGDPETERLIASINSS